MILVCRTCGMRFSAEKAEEEAIIHQFYALKDELPQVISIRILSYLKLFRPAPKKLAWPKALQILSELRDEINKPYVKWENRAARPCSPMVWATAMERITDRPPASLPLKSHGYLRSIVYQVADELDRATEVRHNKAERNGSAGREFVPPGEASQIPIRQRTPEEFARFREQVKKVGKEI